MIGGGVLPIHILTALIGIILLSGSLLIWLSGWLAFMRRWMEDLFTPKRNLFDGNASYTGTVQFFRWFGVSLGVLLVLPTFVVLDIALAALTVYLWWYLARRAKAALVGN